VTTSNLVLRSVENLTVLYRGRRYWHTPQLDQAMEKIINHFGDRKDIPSQFVIEFMDGINNYGLPKGEGWNVWYEPCPVVKTTCMTIVVESKPAPNELLQSLFASRKSSFYVGGKFAVNKADLQRYGKAYHSRHGEYFYLNAPETAIALPQGLKQLEVVK